MKIQVFALWYEPLLGLSGYVCALVKHQKQLIPVGLCSVEKWGMGRKDSLRRGWVTPAALAGEPNLAALKQPHLTRFRFGDDLVAYRIWPTGHLMAYEVASMDASDVFVPGVVPKEVMAAFPKADWARLQTTYGNVPPATRKSWGITRGNINAIAPHFAIQSNDKG